MSPLERKKMTLRYDHSLSLLAALLLLAVAPPVTAQIDYDTNDNRLIEIDSQAKLNAIRYDLDGDGMTTSSSDSANYAANGNGFPSPSSNQCPTSCLGYELTQNLTLTGQWTPIGTFTATFNGNGHTLTGMNVTTSSNGGLFGNLGSGGVIRDVGLITPTVTVSGNNNAIGALVGVALNGSTIYSSYVSGGTVTVGADSINMGGLVGSNSGTIRASYSTAALSKTNPCTGCNTINTGGLVGRLGGIIIASYAAGANSVTGGVNSYHGGFVGQVAGSTARITNSYCDTTVSVASNPVGNRASGVDVGNTAVTGYATADLQMPTGYTDMYLNWNVDLDGDGALDYPWKFGTSSDYPTLNTPAQRMAATPAATDYDANDNGLIDIGSLEQLNAMRWDMNGDGDPDSANANAYGTAFGGRTHTASATTGRMGCPTTGCIGYELTTDLTFPSSGRFSSWIPLGGFLNCIFDGKGYTLTDLNVSFNGYAGLIGEIGGLGIVRNVGLVNPMVTSTANGRSAGALAGIVNENGRVKTSYVRGGTISATGTPAWVGGLIGETVRNSTIQSTYSNATVTTTSTAVRMGGLVGGLERQPDRQLRLWVGVVHHGRQHARRADWEWRRRRLRYQLLLQFRNFDAAPVHRLLVQFFHRHGGRQDHRSTARTHRLHRHLRQLERQCGRRSG